MLLRHTHDQNDRGALPLITRVLLFAPLVLVGNAVGAVLRYPDLGSAVVFPPYALLTAALVASPLRHWIWYIAVAAVAHTATSLTQWPTSWVLVADAANIARALVAALLLRRLFGGLPRLDGARPMLEFLVSAVVVAPAVGATIGAANLVWHGASPTYWRAWTFWFLSNALTALTMLPGLLVAMRDFRSWRTERVDRRRLIEALCLAGAIGVACTVSFLGGLAGIGDVKWVLYALLPLLIWAALRFGHGGASVALTVVAGAAIWGADRGTGPFLSPSPVENVLSLQLFIVLTSLPVFCIAAIGGAGRGAVELYRALLASLQEHVAILDARGIVIEANQSWERFAAEEHACPLDRVRTGDDYLAACRGAAQLAPPPEMSDLAAQALRALAGAESVLTRATRHFEMEYEQGGQRDRQWYIVRIEALERADGGAVVTRTNITERHLAQLEVEDRRREVTHLARIGVLGQLSGALAHELRQPLASILSNADAGQLMIARPPIDTVELTKILHDIAAEDRRAANVIESLRLLLKRGDAIMRPVDTRSVIDAVFALARSEVISRRITATVDVEPVLPPILADPVQVQQVLLNLILNACEAMAATPIGERVLRLTARATTAGDVRLTVRDFGSGIPAMLVDRLFEPFTTTKAEGLGLGLSISRTIVVAHGGRIWAENNAGGGASVHCEFPAARAAHPGPTLETRPSAYTSTDAERLGN